MKDRVAKKVLKARLSINRFSDRSHHGQKHPENAFFYTCVMDAQIDGRTDDRTNGWTDKRTDGRTDRQMDGRTDGRKDGWTENRQTLL